MQQFLREYSAAILPYKLGEEKLEPIITEDRQALAARTEQATRAAARTGNPYFVLLGVGNGQLADALANTLPEDVTMVVADLQPERVRQALATGKLQWWQNHKRHTLLTDTSPWALLTLLAQCGIHSATTYLQPNLPASERDALRKWQRLFTASKQFCPNQMTTPPPLTVATILQPTEPKLDEFFAHIPTFVHRIVAVWDAAQIPENLPSCAVPVTHLARPLANDFSAQRNFALENCSTKWVLFLDGDERLSPITWERIPGMLHSDVGGYALLRQTYLGDESTCRAGFGLWPDIQLRLFRKTEGTTFIRPVHEVITNLPGPTALCITEGIQHYSHLLKSPEQLEAKLQGFDAAAGKAMHRLNENYPTVPTRLLNTLANLPQAGTCLQLPNLR